MYLLFLKTILFLDLPSNIGGSFQLPEGIPEVLHPNFPVSLRRSSTYSFWEIKIPCLEYETFILRKYFNFPNSFISNCVANFSFRVSFSISSSL
ncbi:hypothetical protein CR513_10946, partial [Mucuna pruriens]